ncbi:MAG: NUDIX domain-containing protein [Pseudomonadota bacterium]|nr:NUDIX domain-containing protein [Pseudomonadota bacterium]
MTDEIIDIYDENMNPIGTATKAQAHREGLWHKAFRCWIIKPLPENKCKVWMQLRSSNKRLYPNLLATSAAGHLKSGEQNRDGIREIEEELGLKIPRENLVKLFTSKRYYRDDNMIDNEFNPTYLCEVDKDFSELTLQPNEVDGIFEFDLEDLINLFNKKIDKIFSSGLVKTADNKSEFKTGYFWRKDFVPHDDGYYPKVFNTIKRYREGLSPEAAE